MDEHEWDACGDPNKMLRFLQSSGKLSDREVRRLADAFLTFGRSHLPARRSIRAEAGLRDNPLATARVMAWYMRYKPERRILAHLLRDILGPLPFRPLPPLPRPVRAWNDGLIPKLATSIYGQPKLPEGTLDRDRLAVLADALEEAGVTDQEVLGHLRQQGLVHVRGCFAVDLVLEKE